MRISQFQPRAWMIAGVMGFVLGSVSAEEVTLSTGPLTGPATGVISQAPEPFVNPFWTKIPKVVSSFGKRAVPAALKAKVVVTSTWTAPSGPEIHEGLDYAAFPGSVVKASRSGKVIFAGFSKMYASRAKKSDQHRLVIIRHPDGMSSRYVHLNSLHVRPGQEVQAGHVLGTLAESDEWTEPVLHFEIRGVQGQPVDPGTILVPVQALSAGDKL